MMCNNPNLDFVIINAYTKFGKILSMRSQDVERKPNYDGITDGRKDGQPISNIASLFQSGAIKKRQMTKIHETFPSMQRYNTLKLLLLEKNYISCMLPFLLYCFK